MAFALAVGVAELVAQSGKIADNGLAVAENALEYLLRVLGWREIEALGGCIVEFRQVVIVTIGSSCP